MKSAKASRTLDEFGRISLPIEMRRQLGITSRDPLSIVCDGDTITIRKVQCSCVFCGRTDKLLEMSGKHACEDCIKELSSRQ